MNALLPFLKPYRKRFVAILFILLADVGGSLLVPTITADMINMAISRTELSQIVQRGLFMLIIALISGGLTLLGSWLCARLSANLGRVLELLYMTSH